MPRHCIHVERTCRQCSKKISVTEWEFAHGQGRFCSLACYNSFRQVPIIDKFFERVGKKQSNGCILWTGRLSEDGYGRFDSNGKQHLAHRTSYELFVGAIPKGMHVLHRCDTPACIRPTCLFIGTQADNVADMMAKNRKPMGEQTRASKLTEKLVKEIRERYRNGERRASIARVYGVSFHTITKIVRREYWKHVT
jgi:hypothetical protein